MTPAVTKLTAVKVEKRAIRATVTTTATTATAKVYIQRAIRVRGKIRWLRTGVIRIVKLKKGTTKIVLARPKRSGIYRVRMSVKAGSAKSVTLTRQFRFKK